MRLDAVNEIISQAKALESQSNRLQRSLSTQILQLPDMISIDGNPAVQHLLNFIIDYIELTPQTLACLAARASQVRLDDLFQPFFQAALDYFVPPSAILNLNTGLDGLLIRAYQCIRLIEELYDNNRSLRNSAACELETTQANLLVHHLIGEPFSNEVDEAVLYTMNRLMRHPDYYYLDVASHIENDISDEWKRLSLCWKNLLLQHRIHFNLYARLI